DLGRQLHLLLLSLPERLLAALVYLVAASAARICRPAIAASHVGAADFEPGKLRDVLSARRQSERRGAGDQRGHARLARRDSADADFALYLAAIQSRDERFKLRCKPAAKRFATAAFRVASTRHVSDQSLVTADRQQPPRAYALQARRPRESRVRPSLARE